MATWKKVIVSGSAAELASITVDGNIVNSGTVAGTQITGSFTGSFTGDGSNLTGLPAAAISSYTSASNNRVITSVDASTVNSEANLTFDGSVLTVTGKVTVSSTITGSALQLTSAPAGTDDTVLVIDANGNVVTDEIDTRVWGSTLVDASGTPADNQIAVFTDANTVEGTAGLTYTGAAFSVTGTGTFSSTLTASAIQATSLPAGTDNTVVVVDAAGNLVTDEIDARVWGTSLVDGTGAATRLAYWSDTDSLTSNASLTYDGTLLTVGSSTFGTNVVIAGDLTVAGNTFNQQVSNLLVEDRFILLNSGSASGDGGIIIQTETTPSGSAFGWDDSAVRFALQTATALASDAITFTPDAFIAAVVDIDAGMSDIATYQKNGNIKVDSGDIYIYA